MRKSLRVACIAVLAMSGALAVPSTANADVNPEPWEPWEQPEWRAGAGVYCDFAMQLEVVSQDIERRTLERYPDGTVKLEEYRGPLISEFVREDTGQRVRTDAGGRGLMEYYSDGQDKSMTTIGPVGNGFKAGNDFPRGYYVMEGFHVFTYDRDGGEHMAVDGGDEFDVCAALA